MRFLIWFQSFSSSSQESSLVGSEPTAAAQLPRSRSSFFSYLKPKLIGNDKFGAFDRRHRKNCPLSSRSRSKRRFVEMSLWWRHQGNEEGFEEAAGSESWPRAQAQCRRNGLEKNPGLGQRSVRFHVECKGVNQIPAASPATTPATAPSLPNTATTPTTTTTPTSTCIIVTTKTKITATTI